MKPDIVLAPNRKELVGINPVTDTLTTDQLELVFCELKDNKLYALALEILTTEALPPSTFRDFILAQHYDTYSKVYVVTHQ